MGVVKEVGEDVLFARTVTEYEIISTLKKTLFSCNFSIPFSYYELGKQIFCLDIKNK